MLYLSGAVRKGLPVMLSMGMGNKIPPDVPWAADNGRFGPRRDRYTNEKYMKFLTKHSHAKDLCLFATAPDVVGDAAATLEMSAPMYEQIRSLGYPVALVGQDGLENLDVPWDSFDAFFVGGSTEWKLSEAARHLCIEARRRGKHVHMGRVNSLKRMRIAEFFGCDSADGTRIAFGPDINEPIVRGWVKTLKENPSLWAKVDRYEDDSEARDGLVREEERSS